MGIRVKRFSGADGIAVAVFLLLLMLTILRFYVLIQPSINYREDREFYQEIQTYLQLISLAALIFALGIAFFSDRMGRIKFLVPLSAITTFAFIGIVFYRSHPVWITCYTLFSFGVAAIIPLVLGQVCTKWDPRWLISAICVLNYLPTIYGSTIGSLITNFTNNLTAITPSIIAFALVIVLALFSPRKENRRVDNPPDNKFIKHSVFYLLVIGGLFTLGLSNAVSIFFPAILLQKFDFSLAGNPIFAMPTYFRIAGIVLGGVIADSLFRHKLKAIVYSVFVLTLIVNLCLFTFFDTDSAQFFVLVNIISQFFLGLVIGPFLYFLFYLINRRYRAYSIALLLLLISLSDSLLAVLTGLLSDWYGTNQGQLPSRFQAAVATTACICLIGSVLYLISAVIISKSKLSAEQQKHLELKPYFRSHHLLPFRYCFESTRKSRIVKNGFSWPAFFFGPFWAFSKGLVTKGFVILAVLIFINVTLAFGFPRVRIDLFVFQFTLTLLAPLIINAILGAFGNTWLKESLEQKGYEYSNK